VKVTSTYLLSGPNDLYAIRLRSLMGTVRRPAGLPASLLVNAFVFFRKRAGGPAHCAPRWSPRFTWSLFPVPCSLNGESPIDKFQERGALYKRDFFRQGAGNDPRRPSKMWHDGPRRESIQLDSTADRSGVDAPLSRPAIFVTTSYIVRSCQLAWKGMRGVVGTDSTR